MASIQQAADLLRKAENILIITHIRPDGDAAGSGCALCLGLRALGKTAYLACNPPSMRRYIPYMVPYFPPDDFHPCFLAAVDTPSEEQFPEGLRHLAQKTDLAIDHHGTNSGYARFSYVEADSASTGELIYLLLQQLQAPLTSQSAEALYIALTTDTNCFRTPGTTGRTLTIAGALREREFDAAALTREFFETKSPARLRLESALFATMVLSDGLCIMTLPQSTISACGAAEDDMDKISLLSMLPERTEAGLFLRELSDGSWKVTLRTKGTIHAGNILHRLSPSGGGHADAAGAVVKGPPQQIVSDVLSLLKSASA